MRATPGPIDGLFIIDLDIRDDAERPGGSFREVFHAERFAQLGLPPFVPVQWNVSESAEGTLRGFHAEPWSKLVHVAAGAVFAAIADLRADSPTAGTVWSGELDRTRALFVGAGLGNAFQAVSAERRLRVPGRRALVAGRQVPRGGVGRPRPGGGVADHRRATVAVGEGSERIPRCGRSGRG